MKVLIAFVTKAGSTREIAEAIAQPFRAEGFGVDVRELRDIRDIAGYDAIVLGGPIYFDKIMPEVVQFATKWRAALASVPVAYFIVGGTLKDDTPAIRQVARAALLPLEALKEPVEVGLFAGKVDSRSVGLLYRLMLKVKKAPDGDWRDWDAIGAWGTTVACRMAELLKVSRVAATV